MRGLDALRDHVDPTVPADPFELLLAVGKTMRGEQDVAKRATRDTVGLPLDQLQVDPAYQRPPDRDKIAAMLHKLRHGANLDPIKVNCRPDGSLWITDGQHRAAARTLNGESTVQAYLTRVEQQQEPAETNLMAKVAADGDRTAITRLLGAGAQRNGKRLTLDLGNGGSVTYLPHGDEHVAKTERGQLQIEGNCPEDTLKALELDQLLA